MVFGLTLPNFFIISTYFDFLALAALFFGAGFLVGASATTSSTSGSGSGAGSGAGWPEAILAYFSAILAIFA